MTIADGYPQLLVVQGLSAGLIGYTAVNAGKESCGLSTRYSAESSAHNQGAVYVSRNQ